MTNDRHRLLAAAVAASTLALALAGCGGSSGGSAGSGGSGGGGGTPGNGGGINEDPAKAVARAAGLMICSEHQISSTAITEPGFAGARVFAAAPDCAKKGPRTSIVVATYTTKEGVAAGAADIKKRYPGSAVTTYKTLVIGVQGPKAETIVKTIEQHISSGQASH